MSTECEARCTYCDGTGDVHGLDGEWRGVCSECTAALVNELDAAAGRLTQRTNNPLDGLLNAAARKIEELAAQAAPSLPPVQVGAEAEGSQHEAQVVAPDASTWAKVADEVTLVLSDPDSELSRGAKRALGWIAAVAGRSQGDGG